MRSIRDHVETLFREIPESDRKESLKREIIENLQEKVADLVAQGKSEEDAVNKAIVEFGDIGDIRDELRTQQELPIKRSNAGSSFGFAVCGSLLLIGLLVFLNVTTSPQFPWSVIPAFGVLWWPLAAFFEWKRHR